MGSPQQGPKSVSMGRGFTTPPQALVDEDKQGQGVTPEDPSPTANWQTQLRLTRWLNRSSWGPSLCCLTTPPLTTPSQPATHVVAAFPNGLGQGGTTHRIHQQSKTVRTKAGFMRSHSGHRARRCNVRNSEAEGYSPEPPRPPPQCRNWRCDAWCISSNTLIGVHIGMAMNSLNPPLPGVCAS